MRLPTTLLVASVALALATPASAAIKALTLPELMSLTSDTIDGQVVASQTFRVDDPDHEGAVFTKLTIVGESMRTGEKVSATYVFRGSHLPADEYATSEMPALSDVRVGTRSVFFVDSRDDYVAGPNVIWNFANVFRVETVRGNPVVIGKGEGAVFAQNVSLASARDQVRTVHLSLEAMNAKILPEGMDK